MKEVLKTLQSREKKLLGQALTSPRWVVLKSIPPKFFQSAVYTI
jgi:hypothetical protein